MTTTTVKERPILFSGEMVRAIFAGRKTQTRRVIKGTHKLVERAQPGTCNYDFWFSSPTHERVGELKTNPCPYGKPGDRLWVRETWAPVQACTHSDPGSLALAAGNFYRASDGDMDGEIDRWRPSIYMPRAASRILLEVTDVRVERVQDISARDACFEGWPGKVLQCCRVRGCDYDGVNQRDIITATNSDDDEPVLWFGDLWDSINAARGYSWEANPWVWVVEFKMLEPTSPAV